VVLPQIYMTSFRPDIYHHLCTAVGLTFQCSTEPLVNGDDSKLYQITLTGKMTLAEMTRRLYLLSIVWDRSIRYENVSINEDQIRKVADIIKTVNPPYYLRKQLLLRMVGIHSKAVEKFKSYFETPQIKLTAGTNAIVRQRFVENILNHFDLGFDTLIDFGCGEHPCKKWRTWRAEQEANWKYIAIDSDPAVQEKLNKIKTPGVVVCAEAAEAQVILESEGRTPVVLATEVIEHLPLDAVTSTLETILSWKPPLLIMTTPNRAFNKHYQMDEEETRHPDHTKEYTLEEWTVLVQDAGKKAGYAVQVEGLGDTVEGSDCILGAILRPLVPKEPMVTKDNSV